jgi:hypothetical protein
MIVEIRPGVDSPDASLWAKDVYKMLARYAQRCGYAVEPRPASGSTYTFTIIGRDVGSVFKFEAGTHRVQRVPVSEIQGRIHTSTAIVDVRLEAGRLAPDLATSRSIAALFAQPHGTGHCPDQLSNAGSCGDQQPRRECRLGDGAEAETRIRSTGHLIRSVAAVSGGSQRVSMPSFWAACRMTSASGGVKLADKTPAVGC